MKYRKEILTTAGTLACAIGIGFFMQSSESPAEANFQGEILANADAAILDIGAVTLTAAEFSDTSTRPAVRDAETPVAVTDDPTRILQEPVEQVLAAIDVEEPSTETEAVTALQCEITANARPVAAAMVNLTLEAPCLPDERVTVHHSGLLFSQTTDETGALDITVPALSRDAVFIVAFSNGEGGVAQTTVEEMVDFDRVALQWKGEAGFQLHAREFGAEYGSAGHVWSGAARDMSYGVTGQGGFISKLGNPDVPDGLMAEVYTFPASTTAQNAGNVALSVETEVGQNNCGLEIEAQTLQTFSGNDITTRDLTLSVPDCDAAGNFLVLNNLFEDLKIASN
jgi:hypothetical protein